ncbi:hypothetical protein [Frankia sp. CiP3]|nr:hypothetical protein [Frankia sp. CiP3]
MLVDAEDDPESGLRGGEGLDSDVLSGPPATRQDVFWAPIPAIDDLSDTP